MIIFNTTNEQDKQDKPIIYEAINSLADEFSFYSVLQYQYNNDKHFNLTNKSICDPKFLHKIYLYSQDKSNNTKVIVHGGIHHNNHTSGVLRDENNRGIFVKDTYIQFQLYPDDFNNNNKRHFLMYPPNIGYPVNMWYYDPDFRCFQYNKFIFPTFYQN